MAYSKLYYPPTSNGLQKTLGAALDDGTTSAMTLSNVTGIQNKPGVVVINRIDSNSVEKSAALREYISYTAVSGSTLTTLTRGLGGCTDQDHAVGSVVEFIPDITFGQALIDAFLVEHGESDATHSASVIAKLAGAQTFTGAKTFTTGLLKAVDVTSGTGVSTLPTSSDTLVGKATTDVFTNKTMIATTNVVEEISTIADSATPTPTGGSLRNLFTVTALAQAATFAAPSGTPANGNKLIIRILDNATARALSWNAIYAVIGTTLPTTTVLSKYTYVGCVYNSASSKWDVLAVNTQA